MRAMAFDSLGMEPSDINQSDALLGGLGQESPIVFSASDHGDFSGASVAQFDPPGFR